MAVSRARGIGQEWRGLVVAATRRNEAIVRRHAAGESQSSLAREYGITRQRVWSIVRRAAARPGGRGSGGTRSS